MADAQRRNDSSARRGAPGSIMSTRNPFTLRHLAAAMLFSLLLHGVIGGIVIRQRFVPVEVLAGEGWQPIEVGLTTLPALNPEPPLPPPLPVRAVAGKTPEKLPATTGEGGKGGETELPPVDTGTAVAPETPTPPAPAAVEPPPSPEPPLSAAVTEEVPPAGDAASHPTMAADREALPHNRLLPVKRERLLFDVYLLGIPVGEAEMEARVEEGEITITSRVRSNTVISTLYPVDDLAEARLKGGKPSTFRVRQQEGGHVRDVEVRFDQSRQSATFIDHLTGKSSEHKLAEGDVWDVMSAFYATRRSPLEPGNHLVLAIFDSGKMLSTRVEVLRRERILVGEAERETVVIRPVLLTEGLFRRSGEIRIWLTDDGERLPVRMKTAVFVGPVSAVLRSVTVER